MQSTYSGFEIVPPITWGANRREGGVKIHCTSCHNELMLPTKNLSVANANELIETRFRRHNWYVGKDRRHDFCPTCQVARNAPKLKLKPKPEDAPVLHSLEELDLLLDAVPLQDTVPETPPKEPVMDTPKVTTPAEPKKTLRKKLTALEMLAAGGLIQRHMKRVFGTEWWSFDEGWDDAKIAAEVGAHVSVEQVVNFRRDMGYLFKPVGKGNMLSNDRFEALEARMTALEELLMERSK